MGKLFGQLTSCAIEHRYGKQEPHLVRRKYIEHGTREVMICHHATSQPAQHPVGVATLDKIDGGQLESEGPTLGPINELAHLVVFEDLSSGDSNERACLVAGEAETVGSNLGESPFIRSGWSGRGSPLPATTR